MFARVENGLRAAQEEYASAFGEELQSVVEQALRNFLSEAGFLPEEDYVPPRRLGVAS